VEFPERSGALVKFLRVLNPVWNISLFHYRQSGNRASTILLGLQVLRSLLSVCPQILHIAHTHTQGEMQMVTLGHPDAPVVICKCSSQRQMSTALRRQSLPWDLTMPSSRCRRMHRASSRCSYSDLTQRM
jgi:C-terminal regulatory domain of Threonine dehydratase